MTKKRFSDRTIFWSMIVALAVDLDSIMYPFLGIPPYYHRRYIVHSPFFWAIAFTIFYLILYFFTKRTQIVLPFAIGIFSHLFFDSFYEGIMWLYPFTAQLFGFNLPILSARPFGEWVISYLTNPYALALETTVVLIALRILQKTSDMKKFVYTVKHKTLKQIVIYLLTGKRI